MMASNPTNKRMSYLNFSFLSARIQRNPDLERPEWVLGHSSSESAAASVLLSSRLVSHLHSSTTRALFCWTRPPPQCRGTSTVRALEGAQREQGARCLRRGAAAADSASGGTNRELHWPKHSRLCTVTVLHPGAVTRCRDGTKHIVSSHMSAQEMLDKDTDFVPVMSAIENLLLHLDRHRPD